MTADSFNLMNTLQQANFLWLYGTPVSELYEEQFSCALYQLEDFYVEVKYNKQNFFLYKMCGFTLNCPILDQYIGEIDISGLV
jgi:hypothetical protein